MKKLATLIFAACSVLSAAQAQTVWPERAVRLVVPGSAGTITDVLGREFAQALGAVVRQPVYVENIVGADQQIGTQAVVNAKPDGHTLLFVSSSTTVLDPVLRASLPYDLARDLAPACGVFRGEIVMNMSTTLPFKSAAEFAASAKEAAEKYSFGYSSATTRLAGEMFQQAAGIKLLGVPYKGSAGGLADVASGLVHLFFIDPVSADPHYRSGKIRALMTATKERVKAAPDVPTSAEAGFPGFVMTPSTATWMPSGTPAAIQNAVRAALDRTVRSPEFAAVLAKHNLQSFPPCGDDLARYTREEIVIWDGIARKSGIERQ